MGDDVERGGWRRLRGCKVLHGDVWFCCLGVSNREWCLWLPQNLVYTGVEVFNKRNLCFFKALSTHIEVVSCVWVQRQKDIVALISARNQCTGTYTQRWSTNDTQKKPEVHCGGSTLKTHTCMKVYGTHGNA